ncbi:MAG: TOBE domain-containing protein, partial [Atribacterota bacterium]|nr:TOBE domain-containing protein [Atribacterota bacterium]
THDQIEAMTMADKIVVMNFGDIQQIGSPHEVYHYPANLFVARFIGSPGMNFIPGTLHRREKLGVLIDGDSFIPLDLEQSQTVEKILTLSSQVVVGIRPENILIAPEGEALVKGEVYVFEPLGAQNVVTFKIGTHLLKALLPGDTFFTVGERIGLRFKEIRIFNAQDQKLIA